MTAAPVSFVPDEFIAWAEKAERRFTGLAITAAPVLGLLPSAIITAVHCATFLHFGPVSSVLTGAGVEVVSIAIVATRVVLSRRGMAHLEIVMDRAFAGYLAVIATVNANLNIANGFTVGWTPLLFGSMLAELALGALPVPVAWLVATRNEIAMMDQAALIADDKREAQRAQERADKLADEDRAQAFRLAEMREKSALRVAEKSATTQPAPTTAQPVAQLLLGRIDHAKLRVALVANRNATQSELAQLFGVSSSAVGKYIRTHGGRDAISG